jgi:hypothetical protein
MLLIPDKETPMQKPTFYHHQWQRHCQHQRQFSRKQYKENFN